MDSATIQELSTYFPRLDVFYEEGTWIPTYLGTSPPGTTTYDTGRTRGSFVRLGRQVIAMGSVVWTAATGGVEGLVSLPHTVSADVDTYAATVTVYGMTFGGFPPGGYIQGGTNFIRLLDIISGGGAAFPFSTSGQIIFSAVYLIDP